jgi:hypothetical protein
MVDLNKQNVFLMSIRIDLNQQNCIITKEGGDRYTGAESYGKTARSFTRTIDR